LNARISELQEKLNAFDQRYKLDYQKKNICLNICFRCVTQNDEIARLQLENNILQEKLTNEKRKVSILEVYNINICFLFF